MAARSPTAVGRGRTGPVTAASLALMTATSSRRGDYSPMVHLRTVPDVFHARVIAARLGADGILTELRGAVGGPYPIGSVSVWVTPADEEIACELLLADELEAAFEEVPEGWEPTRSPPDGPARLDGPPGAGGGGPGRHDRGDRGRPAAALSARPGPDGLTRP